jgi:GT2 family glycosyltransferase
MAKKAPLVVAVVLTWNDSQAALKCVRSVLASDYANLQVVLLDNASNDGTPAAAGTAFGANKRFSLIVNDSNRGYVANNVGIKEGLKRGADFVLILNNDTVVEKNAVSRMVATAVDYPNAAAIAPLLVLGNDPTRVWSAGTGFNSIIFKPVLWGRGKPVSCFTEPREVPLAVGAALLVRTQAIRKVGLLDEKYFIYNEETKWEILMKRAGYTFVLEPAARVVHSVGEAFGGGETPVATYYLVRNRGYLIADLCPLYLKPIAYASLLAETVLRAVRGIVSGKHGHASAALTGLGHFLTGVTGRKPGMK